MNTREESQSKSQTSNRDAGPEQGIIPYLHRANLTRAIRDSFADDDAFEYFWSNDWTPEFYRMQAKLGYISVAHNFSGRNILIPELQAAYGVLDWEELVVDRGVNRILDSGLIDSEQIQLRITPDPTVVMAELDAVWGDENWMVREYQRLMHRLSTEEEKARDASFRLWGITLEAAAEQRPICGELGYTTGNIYTSLSGFFHRGNRRWNHFGKLQLVLLAKHLESRGIAFWNLGHPHMDYKIQLGARITPRREFLKRWDVHCDFGAVDISKSI